MTLNPEQFDRLRERIARLSGIELGSGRMGRLMLCIEERMQSIGRDSVPEYLELLERPGGSDELQTLASILEPNETYFFRDAVQLRVFSEEVLPRWIEERIASGRRRFTVWSAGSSTGEEAYTIAILFLEAVEDLLAWSTYILGTDINRSLLEVARNALYSRRAVGEIPSALLERHFDSEGERFRVRAPVRSLVHFTFGNLSSPAAPARVPFDFIFCRNVLMYFTEEARIRAIENLASRLAPDGILFLGYSDPSSWVRGHGLVPVPMGRTLVYRREDES